MNTLLLQARRLIAVAALLCGMTLVGLATSAQAGTTVHKATAHVTEMTTNAAEHHQSDSDDEHHHKKTHHKKHHHKHHHHHHHHKPPYVPDDDDD